MKIEKNIPIPPVGPRSKYPFAEMEVGDSFLIEGKENTCRARKSQFSKTAHGDGKKFLIRKTENGTYRCWRTQ